jgi:hypothetical protein
MAAMPATVDLKTAHVGWADGFLKIVAEADVDPDLWAMASVLSTHNLKVALGEDSPATIVIQGIEVSEGEDAGSHGSYCEMSMIPVDVKGRVLRSALTKGLADAVKARTLGNLAAADLKTDLEKGGGFLG